MVAKGSKSPKVFLSHSIADREVARSIGKEIEDAGFEVLSVEGASRGENIHLQLGKALETADAMVVLLSPAAVQSPTLGYELSYALGSQRFAGRVVPVIIEDTDDIPWILRRFQLLRGGKNAERTGKAVVERLTEAAKATGS